MKSYEDYRKLAAIMSEKTGAPVMESAEGLLSFTPYIDNSCSAACRFCSERLTKNGMDSCCDGMCADYEERLASILSRLDGRDVFLSLSGKEPTESPHQLEAIRRAVCSAREKGLRLADAVMYSNLSGFCKNGDALTETLASLPVTRIEFSRHHYDEGINQSIMLFRRGEKIRENSALLAVTEQLGRRFPLRMVCVLQRSGVGDMDGILRYLDFACSLKVRDVVFRELCVFGSSVDSGATTDYIISNRVELWDILPQLGGGFVLESITQGYYYFSFIYRYGDMRVCFEMSDYEEMERKHSGERVHKLIFYPDGRLCRSWNKKGVMEDKNGKLL